MPEQLDTKILPLLPLQTGVVLPHMVVTLTLETPEARRLFPQGVLRRVVIAVRPRE